MADDKPRVYRGGRLVIRDRPPGSPVWNYRRRDVTEDDRPLKTSIVRGGRPLNLPIPLMKKRRSKSRAL